ncbi:unnamed protein product, partial [Urochloa humidicola]
DGKVLCSSTQRYVEREGGRAAGGVDEEQVGDSIPKVNAASPCMDMQGVEACNRKDGVSALALLQVSFGSLFPHQRIPCCLLDT